MRPLDGSCSDRDYLLHYLTTDLDPKLRVAYEFGASFLAPKSPEGAGRPDEAGHATAAEEKPGSNVLTGDHETVHFTRS